MVRVKGLLGMRLARRGTPPASKWLLTSCGRLHPILVAGADMGRAGIENPTVGDRFSWERVEQPDGRTKAIDLLREGAEFAAREVFRHEPVRQ